MIGSRKAVYSVLLMLLSSALGGVFIANSAFGQTLSVAISSPSSGATFTTGQTVTITATVSDGGNPVSGAAVTANSPTGATISLTPTSTAGTYMVNYGPLGTTTPPGTWTITVTASSGGVTQSAQVAVFIVSGSLTVTFLSPSSGTLYNVGETATIKAMVIHPDSTAIPSSSAVTFAKPNGLTAPMATDPTDPSGRTWVAGYTIMSTDALPQGFDWPITITATAGTSTGSAVQHVSLFNSLLVSASTFSNSAYNTPQDTFTAGQAIFVKAVVTLHDGTQASSGSSSFEVSGTSVASSPVGMTYSPSLAAWTGSYLVLPNDQIGAQFVAATASDAQGNTGSGIHVISLAAGSSQGLSVFITAPAANTVFNRGEIATIAALVTLNGAPVSGATVITNSPTGATITLVNTAGGVYSGQYGILSTDPAGPWMVGVSAMLNGAPANSHETLTISNSLNVAISTYATNAYVTPQDTFVAGQTVFVKEVVSLHDGTQVSLGSASFVISGTGVTSSPVTMTYSPSFGAWTGSHVILPTDLTGFQVVTGSASDTQGNAGGGMHVISVATSSSQGLSVFINTPISNTVFNRGQVVSITTLVTLNGAPVSGATVTTNSPTGAVIALANTAGGAYTGQYTVLNNDPTGAWTLSVHATLNGQAANTQEPLAVSNSLKVTASTYSSSSYSTPQSSFSAGQAIFVKAQVTFQDGTTVTSGTATIVITGTSISATPMALVYSSTLNAWAGSYTVLQSDQSGNQVLTTTATDFTGNTGSGLITVMIGVTTPSPTPLEAGITFNPTTHDIQVDAICGVGCVAPTTVTQTSTAPASASQNDDGQGDGDGHGNGHDQGHHQDEDSDGYVNRTYTIADSGGHVVTLIMQIKNNENEVKANILSIQYGSASPVTLAGSNLDFKYSLTDNGSINTLDENAGTGNATGHAHYDSKDGVTTITIGSGGDSGEGGDDEGDGGQNTVTNNGLWLLELTTSNGTLGLSYFQSA